MVRTRGDRCSQPGFAGHARSQTNTKCTPTGGGGGGGESKPQRGLNIPCLGRVHALCNVRVCQLFDNVVAPPPAITTAGKSVVADLSVLNGATPIAVRYAWGVSECCDKTDPMMCVSVACCLHCLQARAACNENWQRGCFHTPRCGYCCASSSSDGTS